MSFLDGLRLYGWRLVAAAEARVGVVRTNTLQPEVGTQRCEDAEAPRGPTATHLRLGGEALPVAGWRPDQYRLGGRPTPCASAVTQRLRKGSVTDELRPKTRNGTSTRTVASS